MKLSELWHLYEADIPKFLIEEDVRGSQLETAL